MKTNRKGTNTKSQDNMHNRQPTTTKKPKSKKKKLTIFDKKSETLFDASSQNYILIMKYF